MARLGPRSSQAGSSGPLNEVKSRSPATPVPYSFQTRPRAKIVGLSALWHKAGTRCEGVSIELLGEDRAAVDIHGARGIVAAAAGLPRG